MTDSPASHAATLTIDRAALIENWRLLARRAAPAACAAVVKADAYGLGLDYVVPALAEAGCETFFVAHLEEGRRARALAPRARVVVLNGFPPGAGPDYAAARLTPVLGSETEIAAWRDFANRVGNAAQPAAIHVDSGMHRLGLPLGLARAMLPDLVRARPFPLAFLMSHFVESEVEGSAVTARQAAEFAALAKSSPGLPASLCNSSGLFLGPDVLHDLARPGYALYGGNPTPGRPNPMRPVARLEAPIIQLRTIEDGDAVGYNGIWHARGRRRIATVSIGYADGWARQLGAGDTTQGGEAVVAGTRCPIVGRVSMDLTTLDVTALPESDLAAARTACFLGEGITVDDVAARAGTIGYGVLTALGRRIRRVAVGNPRASGDSGTADRLG